MQKLAASIVCPVLCALVGVASGGDKGTLKIEGTWVAVGSISDGQKVPDETVAKVMFTAVLKDGKYRLTLQGQEFESGSYKTDAAKKPATLDLAIAKGKDEGKTQIGICKIEGDTFTVALAAAGSKDRPKDFSGGPDIVVTILKHKK